MTGERCIKVGFQVEHRSHSASRFGSTVTKRKMIQRAKDVVLMTEIVIAYYTITAIDLQCSDRSN
jgi:hypothetical protein